MTEDEEEWGAVGITCPQMPLAAWFSSELRMVRMKENVVHILKWVNGGHISYA